MSETLTKLITESHAIVTDIIEHGGEMSAEMKQEFEQVNLDIEAKVDAYAYVLERLDLEAEHFRQKALEFQRIANSIKNAHKNLKERLVFNMKLMKTKEIFGDDYRFKLRKPAGRLEIFDSDEIPAHYLKQVVVTEIDKADLKTDIMANAKKGEPYEALTAEEIPGARVIMEPALLKYPNQKGNKRAVTNDSADSKRITGTKNDKPSPGRRKRKKASA